MLEDLRDTIGKPTAEYQGWVYDSDFVIGSIPNKPNDKMLVRSMLASLELSGKRGSSASEIEAQLYKEITSKGIRVIAMDECNHCAERGERLSKRGVTDHFKRLVDNTGVTLVLCGLPKFQRILDENEQCRDRAMKSTYMLPYSLTSVKSVVTKPDQPSGVRPRFSSTDFLISLKSIAFATSSAMSDSS